jgi:hypothetical protein
MLGRLLCSLTLCSVAGLWASDKPSNANLPVPPPKGAIVLFDGGNLSNWQVVNGKPAYWKIVDGAMEVDKDCKGHVDCDHVSKQSFGSGHLHVEFWLPLMAGYTGQGRANSGVYIQGRYELQVLDSYQAKMEMGMGGSIYSVAVPRVNAALPPEQWQSYDIYFHAPKFNKGKMIAKPRVTVFWNGVNIHNDLELSVPATPGGIALGHASTGPVLLQAHDCAVRYRNIWWVPGIPDTSKLHD